MFMNQKSCNIEGEMNVGMMHHAYHLEATKIFQLKQQRKHSSKSKRIIWNMNYAYCQGMMQAENQEKILPD